MTDLLHIVMHIQKKKNQMRKKMQVEDLVMCIDSSLDFEMWACTQNWKQMNASGLGGLNDWRRSGDITMKSVVFTRIPSLYPGIWIKNL